jgi:hypothetical protein
MMAFVGSWKLKFVDEVPDFGGEMARLSLEAGKSMFGGVVRGSLMVKNQDEAEFRVVGRVVEFRMVLDAKTQLPRAAVKVELGSKRIANFEFDVDYVSDTATQMGRWLLRSGDLAVDNQDYSVDIEQPVGPVPDPQPSPLPSFAVGEFNVEVQASSDSPFPQFLSLTVSQDSNGKPVIQLSNTYGVLYDLQNVTFMPVGDVTNPMSTGVLFQGTFRSTLLEPLPNTLSASFTILEDGTVSGRLGNMPLSNRQGRPAPMARPS